MSLNIKDWCTIISLSSFRHSVGRTSVVGVPFFVESMTKSAVIVSLFASVTVNWPFGSSVMVARLPKASLTPSSSSKIFARSLTSDGSGSEERTSFRECTSVTSICG